MVQRPNLAVADIAFLLAQKFDFETRFFGKLIEQLRDEKGDFFVESDEQHPTESDEQHLIEVLGRGAAAFNDKISELVAPRIKEDIKGSVLSLQDAADVISSCREVIIQLIEELKAPPAQKMMLRVMAPMLANIASQLYLRSSSPHTAQEYWKWIEVVLQIASEKGQPFKKVFDLEDIDNELWRHLYTKQEFLDQYLNKIGQELNLDTSPLFLVIGRMAMSMEESEQQGFIDHMKERMAQTKERVEAFIREEADRIWEN